jgi:hypothetical protein
MGGVLQGIFDKLMSRYGSEEPDWMKGMLKGVLGGNLSKLAEFVSSKAMSKASGLVDWFSGLNPFGGAPIRTYDHGGYWPAHTGGWNDGGSGEMVFTGEQASRLLHLLERIEGRSAPASTVNVAVTQPQATAQEIGDEIAWRLRFA